MFNWRPEYDWDDFGLSLERAKEMDVLGVTALRMLPEERVQCVNGLYEAHGSFSDPGGPALSRNVEGAVFCEDESHHSFPLDLKP